MFKLTPSFHYWNESIKVVLKVPVNPKSFIILTCGSFSLNVLFSMQLPSHRNPKKVNINQENSFCIQLHPKWCEPDANYMKMTLLNHLLTVLRNISMYIFTDFCRRIDLCVTNIHLCKWFKSKLDLNPFVSSCIRLYQKELLWKRNIKLLI